MMVENVTEEVKANVEKSLMIICKDLLKAWDERQAETKLQKVTIEAFGNVHMPDPDNFETLIMLSLLSSLSASKLEACPRQWLRL